MLVLILLFTSTYLWVKVLLSLGFRFSIFKMGRITYDLPYSFDGYKEQMK